MYLVVTGDAAGATVVAGAEAAEAPDATDDVAVELGAATEDDEEEVGAELEEEMEVEIEEEEEAEAVDIEEGAAAGAVTGVATGGAAPGVFAIDLPITDSMFNTEGAPVTLGATAFFAVASEPWADDDVDAEAVTGVERGREDSGVVFRVAV